MRLDTDKTLLTGVEVHETETQIIILGEPKTEGLTDDEAIELHNCDVMGCGQWHVLFRFNKDRQADYQAGRKAGLGEVVTAIYALGFPDAIADHIVSAVEALAGGGE